MSHVASGEAGAVVDLPNVDLDAMSCDVANVIDRMGYEIDVTADAIRLALPAFLADVLRNMADAADAADDNWETGGDAAVWVAGLDEDEDVPALPTPQTGRAPAMGFDPWHESQGVDLGRTGPGEHYWRCPLPLCDTWAGPYGDVQECKRVGMDHRFEAHDLPAARRTEARKAARRLGGPDMKVNVFDPLVENMAAAYKLPTSTIHLIISAIESVVAGYSHADQLVDAFVRDGLTDAAEPTRRLVLDLAAQLGQRDDWFVRMGV